MGNLSQRHRRRRRQTRLTLKLGVSTGLSFSVIAGLIAVVMASALLRLGARVGIRVSVSACGARRHGGRGGRGATGINRARLASLALCMCAGLCGPGAASAADKAGKNVEKFFDLTLTQGALPAAQRTLRVEQDDAVRLRVSSDEPGELHMHAYRIRLNVSKDAPAETRFKAFASGRYRLEWHAADHAPAALTKPPGHHGPPLAALEVRPR